MSKIDEYVKNRSEHDPEFAKGFQDECFNLDIAVKVKKLRSNLGWSQRELADKINKPQSTIARIEKGTSNPNIKTLNDIARATHKQLNITFEA